MEEHEECGSRSPHPAHRGAKCNLSIGHRGLHWHLWASGTGMFWTEEEARHARKLRVRVGKWLARER